MLTEEKILTCEKHGIKLILAKNDSKQTIFVCPQCENERLRG